MPASDANVAGLDLLGGILVAMWNYMGWDNSSTFAGEVERPERTYPLAMMAAMGLVALTYVLPILAVRHLGIARSGWTTGSWAGVARVVAGPWLEIVIIVGGMLSALGMLNALIMSYTRIPPALAGDGYLPAILARRDPGTGAPTVSILVCAVGWGLALNLGFQRLLQLDLLLYGLSLILEFVAHLGPAATRALSPETIPCPWRNRRRRPAGRRADDVDRPRFDSKQQRTRRAAKRCSLRPISGRGRLARIRCFTAFGSAPSVKASGYRIEFRQVKVKPLDRTVP